LRRNKKGWTISGARQGQELVSDH